MTMLAATMPGMVADLESALVRIGRGDLADQLREVSIDRWTYDDEADAAYLYVTSPRSLNAVDQRIVGVKFGETVSLYDELGINLDLDNHGRLTGIEVMDARGAAPVYAHEAPWHRPRSE